MKKFICIAAALSMLCSSQNMIGYAYGYTRLYRPDTRTTVDLVYDYHKATRDLTHVEMDLDLCDDIKQGLYPTEKMLVESLEHLNREHPQDTTVIWEHDYNMLPAEVHLLTYPQRLVMNRLRNVHFVAADTWRHDYPSCISSLLRGGSLHHRVNRQAIVQQSGAHVWEQYQALMNLTVGKLLTAYGTYRDRVAASRHNDALYRQLFFAKTPYAELADLEMISHLLASPHRHIVVFAGGLHCENIANFLRCYTPFELVHSAINWNFSELPAQELKRIQQEHGSQRPASQPRRPNTPTSSSASRTSKPASRSRVVPTERTASSLSDDQRKNILLGGAVVLGGVLTSAYYEHKSNPALDIGTLAKRNLLTTIKYGVPAALLYLLVNQKAGK